MLKTDFSKTLKEKYKTSGAARITLLKVLPEMRLETDIETLKALQSLDYYGVYITIEKTYADIVKTLKDGGVSTEKLFFVDAASSVYGEKKEAKNCVFVSGPLNIDAIINALFETLVRMGERKKFVFLDSVTTMMLYNSIPRTIRFSNFLIKSLKEKGVAGIIVSLVKTPETEKLSESIEKICDEVISIDGGG